MSEKIILQQALFGYRDGHNLIAASTALAPRVRQFLATVTDSSGPENNIGFEGTITGLPVPETNFYALFRTWPAPEMPRPGCVWSHAMLIQLADLAQVPLLFQLGKLCSRPSTPIDVNHYEQALVLDFSKAEMSSADKPGNGRLHYLVRALYEHPEAGVVILDEESESWENAVFQIWSQQWPRLRREFAFSTGSLSDRRLVGIPFDLQIAPSSSERLWRRSEAPTLLLNFSTSTPEPFSEAIPKWIEVAEDDLRNESNRGFRQFLFDYGSDVEKPRAAFGKLAVTYNHIVKVPESAWADLLRSVGESFPVPNEAVRLKRWLLTLPSSLRPSEKPERAWSIVSFLLDSQYSASYPSLDFDFANSAVYLWKEKREQTINLLSHLVQRDENPSAMSFAEGIASAVDSASLRAISEGHGELVPLIIRHNHAMAFEIDTWKLSGHIQSQVYETLTRLALSQADWGRIVGAMFIAATYVSVREVVAMAGPFAITGAFRWIEHQVAREVLPSHSWRDALASPATALLSQKTDLQPAQLALSAWCVPSEDLRRILFASREDVQRMSEVSPAGIPALRENSDAAANLVLKNFFSVHEALATGTHSSESWWLLSPELPVLRIWRDWDRCEKLRRAVHFSLSQRGKSKRLLEFARTSHDVKIARKVVENYGDDTPSEFTD